MVSVAEKWKAIPDFEGMYEASSTGRIRSIDRVIQTEAGPRRVRGRMMKSAKHYSGYRLIQLCSEGKYTKTTVHALVAAAFIGQRPPGMDVNHIDGNKANNSPDNLEYVTRKGNMEHARRTGLWDNRGEGNGQCRNTEAQVIEAHRMFLNGATYREVHLATGLTYGMMSHVRQADKWKHLNLEPVACKSSAVISDEVREQVRQLYRDGVSQPKIAKALRIGQGSVWRIIHEKEKVT